MAEAVGASVADLARLGRGLPMLRFTLRSGATVDQAETLDDVTLVEEYDRDGRIIDRYRLENLGAAPLRRKGDTNAQWRS